jgi:hypothetical protein
VIAWLALLVVVAISMWTLVPVVWLYIGAQIGEGAGAKIVMLAGAVASIVGCARLLSAVNRRYQRARVRRGFDDTGTFPLEVTLVCSAFAAGAALLVGWVLSGG